MGIKKKVYFNLLLNIKPNLIFGAGYVILYTTSPQQHSQLIIITDISLLTHPPFKSEIKFLIAS